MITGSIVYVDGVNQSSNLTGEVVIDIDESSARIANFTLLPDAGITDLVNWVNKPVTIFSSIDGVETLQFTGIIDTPDFDVETELTTFTCTDNLQEVFETKTKDEINAIIPGFWSIAVFNDSEGWKYAQELLSTIPSSMDMDNSNLVRVTPWQAKATADYVFDDSNVVYESVRVDTIANRRNVINAVNITMQYRYIRLKEREYLYDLNDGLSNTAYVCGQFGNPYPVPSKGRIIDSINQAGWEVTVPPVFQEMPPSATYNCPGDVIFSQNTNLARGVTVTIGKRYSQNVTEKYTIRVESQDSIAEMGEIAVNQSGNLNTGYDLTLWNESKISDGWGDFGTPQTDINNDSYVNKDNLTDRQNAIDTAVNLGQTKILAAHRTNMVSFDIAYDAAIDTIHTVELNHSKLHAKGKVSRVLKSIDTLTGEAICTVYLAISKAFGVGVPGTEQLPQIPDGLPTVPDDQAVDLVPAYHLGGQDPTVYDPLWSGWITDYVTITEPGHVPYPTEFVVYTPQITLNSLENIEPTDDSLINVTIPDDILQ